MVGQASSLSVKDDGQDARPTGNLLLCRLGDCLAAPCLHGFELFSLNCVAECRGLL
jgi:hypothetical protein